MKKVITLLLALVCVFSLFGCSSDDGGDSSSSDVKKAVVYLGASGPLSGGNAEYGKAVENSAKLAVEEINALQDCPFRFEFKMADDEADAEKAANAYASLLDWGMNVSLFTVTSGSGAAVAASYDEDKIFAITPSGSSTALVYTDTKNYKGNFQMCFTDPNQGVASADYIADNNLATNVGIIYRSDDVYSTGVREKFLAEAAVKGLNIVSDEAFVGEDASDFSVQLQKAQENGADLVFLPIYYQPASLILTKANEMAYSPIFFGVDGMDGILTMGLDSSIVEGTYLLTPFAADSSDDATVHYVNAYKAAYGDIPNQFGADAYDAVYAIYNALVNMGFNADSDVDTLYDGLVEQFTSMSFSGVTGTNVTWAENGEVSKAPKAVIIADNAYKAAE